MSLQPTYLRRAAAADYLCEKWGIPRSAKTLAKLVIQYLAAIREYLHEELPERRSRLRLSDRLALSTRRSMTSCRVAGSAGPVALLCFMSV